jgi:DNA (cytosine-5)-methyltransferase 1
MQYRILDLFCGAGGATAGLKRAFGERGVVTGVDMKPQPRYVGDAFIQADALTVDLSGYDLVWASPPCQGYSQARHVVSCAGRQYPKLIAETRARLESSGAFWILENVPGAPMTYPVEVCGTALGLRVRRHRLFDSNAFLFSPGACRHGGGDFGVYAGKVTRIGTRGAAYVASSGRTHYRPQTATRGEGREAMGIPWMTMDELCEAIPPRYAEFLGRQIVGHLDAMREAA